MKKLLFLLTFAVFANGLAVRVAHATVDDALSFALEAVDKYVKTGFTLREDTWGGDLPAKESKAISHQLFKGNEYWFCMGSDVKGAKISVHIYDGDGNLVDEGAWQEDRKDGVLAGASVKPKRTGTYFIIVKIISAKPDEDRITWGLVYSYK